MRIFRILPILAAAHLSWLVAQETPTVTFGTTVVSATGFRGQIYYLKKDTDFLPKLQKMHPVGTIYTTSINVAPQNFLSGFPGITDRFEWFGILYTGKIWIEKEGRYEFSLLSDDGSKLKIDNKEIIDNDGHHVPTKLEGSAILTPGIHELEVSYFQGPRDTVALVLGVTPPGENWRVLNTDHFPTPSGNMQLTSGKIHSIKAGSNFEGSMLAPPRPSPALGK